MLPPVLSCARRRAPRSTRGASSAASAPSCRRKARRRRAAEIGIEQPLPPLNPKTFSRSTTTVISKPRSMHFFALDRRVARASSPPGPLRSVAAARRRAQTTARARRVVRRSRWRMRDVLRTSSTATRARPPPRSRRRAWMLQRCCRAALAQDQPVVRRLRRQAQVNAPGDGPPGHAGARRVRSTTGRRATSAERQGHRSAQREAPLSSAATARRAASTDQLIQLAVTLRTVPFVASYVAKTRAVVQASNPSVELAEDGRVEGGELRRPLLDRRVLLRVGGVAVEARGAGRAGRSVPSIWPSRMSARGAPRPPAAMLSSSAMKAMRMRVYGVTTRQGTPACGCS